jgi:hypothetical protein
MVVSKEQVFNEYSLKYDSLKPQILLAMATEIASLRSGVEPDVNVFSPKRVDHMLRRAGLYVSSQRIALFQCIKQYPQHSFQELHSELRKDIPALSLTTVYSTVKLFKKNGIL